MATSQGCSKLSRSPRASARNRGAERTNISRLGSKSYSSESRRPAESLNLTFKLALWSEHDLLKDFEDKIYATGFKPNGKGF
jgi:hypothetical protein